MTDSFETDRINNINKEKKNRGNGSRNYWLNDSEREREKKTRQKTNFKHENECGQVDEQKTTNREKRRKRSKEGRITTTNSLYLKINHSRRYICMRLAGWLTGSSSSSSLHPNGYNKIEANKSYYIEQYQIKSHRMKWKTRIMLNTTTNKGQQTNDQIFFYVLCSAPLLVLYWMFHIRLFNVYMASDGWIK